MNKYTFTNSNGKVTQIAEYGSDNTAGNRLNITYGNIKQVKQNGSIVAKYNYDELNQLVWAADTNTGLYTQINYDNAGNITSVKEYALSTSGWHPSYLKQEKTYTYGDTNWKDKLTSYNGTAITYDKMGNPLSYRDSMSFEWKKGRQLSKITMGDESVNMTYDTNGMRLLKYDGNYTTNYYYDSNNNLIGLDKAGSTLFFYYDSNGSPTAFKNNDIMYYYVKNLQGDIVKIVKQDGSVAASYTYNAWGKLLSVKDGSNVNVPASKPFHVANLNPYRYRGYIYDTETGLYYLQSRYYDPITGRFLNADDTQFIKSQVLSSNLYTYCLNDPMNYVNYEGQFVMKPMPPFSIGNNVANSVRNSLAINFYLLAYANREIGKKYDFSDNSMILNRIIESNAYHTFLSDTYFNGCKLANLNDILEILYHRNQQILTVQNKNLYFYKNDSMDLYLSIGECSIDLNIALIGNVGKSHILKWRISILIHDNYNFEDWTNSKKIC